MPSERMTAEEAKAIVRVVYPRSMPVADYTWESAWSDIWSDNREGWGAGEVIGTGLTHADAWLDAARRIQKGSTDGR